MTSTQLMPIVMQPDKTSSYPGANLLNLAKIFPQIGLSGTELKRNLTILFFHQNDIPAPHM